MRKKSIKTKTVDPRKGSHWVVVGQEEHTDPVISFEVVRRVAQASSILERLSALVSHMSEYEPRSREAQIWDLISLQLSDAKGLLDEEKTTES